jgi:NDP-sugar pyrophosphorylase family protein
MTLPVAILAGGLATRLRPLTERIPKILLDIAGEPFISRQLEDLARHGVARVVLCVGYLGEMVRETVGDGSRWGMRIDYSFDGDTLLGTGGALRKALPLLGERFLVLYGDSYLLCDYAAVEKAFLSSGRQGIMTVYQNHGKWDTSNVLYKAGRIEIYDKKMRSPAMKHIDYGLGGLSAGALRAYDENTPVDLARVYQDLLARDELAAFEVDRRFYEIGSPAGLEELRHHFAQKAGHR